MDTDARGSVCLAFNDIKVNVQYHFKVFLPVLAGKTPNEGRLELYEVKLDLSIVAEVASFSRSIFLLQQRIIFCSFEQLGSINWVILIRIGAKVYLS